jgi:hypothetical protein
MRFLPLSGADEGIILRLLVVSRVIEGLDARFLLLSASNEAIDARFLCQILLFMQETLFPAPFRAKTYKKRASTA